MSDYVDDSALVGSTYIALITAQIALSHTSFLQSFSTKYPCDQIRLVSNLLLQNFTPKSRTVKMNSI